MRRVWRWLAQALLFGWRLCGLAIPRAIEVEKGAKMADDKGGVPGVLEKRAGRIRLTPQRLLQLLGLPPGHRVLLVREDSFSLHDPRIEIVVMGPLMPDVCEGALAPEVVLPQHEKRAGDSKERLADVLVKGEP